jgi:alkaline phosphatase D
MNLLRSAMAILVALLVSSSLGAQHDRERNAVRHIALGEVDKALAALEMGEAATSETHFVRMLVALEAEETDKAVRYARAALDAGLPFGRLVAGPRERLAPLYATDQYRQWERQNSSLRVLHGPMLGAITSDSASLWLRTAKKGSIQVRVLDADSGKLVSTSEKVAAGEHSDFTAVAQLTGLEADHAYRYEIEVDGTPVPVENSQFQTFPRQGTAASFQVGFGGGAGFVPKWEYMWDTILESNPLAFLMLGDNVYIDDPTHPLTNHYCYNRRQSRPEWRRFTAATGIYSIYDDHDFGLNDCIPGAGIEQPAWKRTVWQTFRQNWVNASYGGGEKQPGCWQDFYIGDVHFILLDGRYYRSREGAPTMLGPVQKKWLLETLASSKGTFKVLASPVPWTAGVKPGSKDTWDGYAAEREEIFSFLEAKRINGVLLIAADRHRTDLRVTPRPGGYDLYEFESSKLTNRHTHKVIETPGLIWGYNKTCSFALMRFNTTAADPTVTFEAITIDQEKVHSHKLKLSELTHK